MSSVAEVFLGISRKKNRTAILKENLLMDVPYFIKEPLWISASDEAALKIIFGGSKPFSKLILKTKWYQSCGCCDDSRSCEQLKKRVTDKYFEKRVSYSKCMLPLQYLSDWCLHGLYV